MMNNTINEIKNSLEGINSRITEAEERISDLEDKIVKITTAEQNKEERMKKIEDSLRDLWDNIQRTNIQIIGVQEAQRVPYRINPRRNIPRHIVIKLSKIKYKEKLSKAAREKQQITYKGIPIRLTADLSAETLQARGNGTIYLK